MNLGLPFCSKAWPRIPISSKKWTWKTVKGFPWAHHGRHKNEWKAAYPGFVTLTSRPGLWLPDWVWWKAAYPGDVTLISRPGLWLPDKW